MKTLYRELYRSRMAISVSSVLGVANLLYTQPALSQESRILEEVVVTAEHRQESIQDTQISMTAFTSENIADMGINNTRDIGDFVPNVTMAPYMSGRSGIGVNIRGIGQNETFVSFDPAVSVYLDDVLIAKNTGALFDVLDLERIEVLRGPQGTLYGRNTMGGALSFVTKKPSDTFKGSVTATIGKYEQQDLKGTINIPVLNHPEGAGLLAVKVSTATINRDGLMDNVLEGARQDEFATRSRDTGMIQVQWEPSDTVTARYAYDKTRIDEIPDLLLTTGTNPDAGAGPLLAAWDLGYQADRPSKVEMNNLSIDKTDVEGHSLYLGFGISEQLSLLSITSSREMETDSQGDLDGTPVDVLQTFDKQSADQFTQELRLIYESAKFNYSVGVFYMEQEGDIDVSTRVFSSQSTTLATMDDDNWAIYGQGTYNLSDRMGITFGARYTEETKRLEKQEISSSGSVTDYPEDKLSFDNFSPMASINYHWTDTVMSYLKISTGFQSGGYNIRERNPDVYYQGFDEETIIAYELGLKADINGRFRFNTALWFSDYDDKRVNNFDPETLSQVVRNAGVVEIYGLELEMLGQLTDHLQIGASYGYTKPEFVEYESPNPDNPSEIIDLSDTRSFPFTPKNTASAYLTYEYPLAIGLIRARLDWTYKDDYTFISSIPERNYQRAYDVWNGRVTLDEIAGPGATRFSASLWIKNIADEQYYSNGINLYSSLGYDVNTYADPRTYGIDLTMSF